MAAASTDSHPLCGKANADRRGNPGNGCRGIRRERPIQYNTRTHTYVHRFAISNGTLSRTKQNTCLQSPIIQSSKKHFHTFENVLQKKKKIMKGYHDNTDHDSRNDLSSCKKNKQKTNGKPRVVRFGTRGSVSPSRSSNSRRPQHTDPQWLQLSFATSENVSLTPFLTDVLAPASL